MTILLAEDSPIDALLIRRILEHAGFVVRVVGNGSAALEHLERHPDTALVVADIEMPEVSGIDLLRAMRDRREFRSIPVIFVTGDGDVETVRQAADLGSAGYVLKPITEPSRVLERVERALRAVSPSEG